MKTLHFLKYIVILIIFFYSSNTVFARDPLSGDQGYGSLSYATGSGVIVAVIDSGVWQEHPDLKGTEWVNKKEIPQNSIDDDNNGFIDDYYGWNFIDNNSGMDPTGNHGTLVAGIIAAKHNNDIGVAGVAPGVKIMSLITCDDNGCPRQGVLNAIKYAVDNGAKVINMSLGGDGYLGYSSSYDYYIKYAYDHGVAVIASAGNGDVNSSGQIGQDLNFLKVSPASNDPEGINMIIGVGATNHNSSVKINWSNFGDKFVDVFVPGENIMSTTVPIFSDGFGYDSVDGTSFSAPIVSGAAAALISYYPKLKVYEIVDILKSTGSFITPSKVFDAYNKRYCVIRSFTKEITNGDSIILDAYSLKSDVVFKLKDNKENKFFELNNGVVTILDATKVKIDTSKITLLAGIYSLETNNCKSEWNTLTIKGEASLISSSDLNGGSVVLEPPVIIPNEIIPEKSNNKKQSAIGNFFTPNKEREIIILNTEPIRDDNIKLVQKIFTYRDSNLTLSPEQEDIKSKISISGKASDLVDINNIKLPIDWAISKLKYKNFIDSIILDIDINANPIYKIHIQKPVKFLGIFKSMFDRSVVIDASDIDSSPKGEGKFFDFLFKK